MNTQTTIERLNKLKLTGMVDVYKAVLALPIHDRPSIDLFMSRLADAELQYRVEKRTTLYLKTSKLRYNAIIEDIECSQERNLNKDTLFELATCSFIKQARNILITGCTGSGKSYLACALGRQACHLGYKTLYLPMSKFIEKIGQSKIDGTYLKLIGQVEKHDLIILDDWGLQPLDNVTRLALLQILEDRYERKSVIVTSQLPIAKWFDYIAEPTIADAILDRLISNANRVELKGESMRRKKSK